MTWNFRGCQAQVYDMIWRSNCYQVRSGQWPVTSFLGSNFPSVKIGSITWPDLIKTKCKIIPKSCLGIPKVSSYSAHQVLIRSGHVTDLWRHLSDIPCLRTENWTPEMTSLVIDLTWPDKNRMFKSCHMPVPGSPESFKSFHRLVLKLCKTKEWSNYLKFNGSFL